MVVGFVIYQSVVILILVSIIALELYVNIKGVFILISHLVIC